MYKCAKFNVEQHLWPMATISIFRSCKPINTFITPRILTVQLHQQFDFMDKCDRMYQQCWFNTHTDTQNWLISTSNGIYYSLKSCFLNWCMWGLMAAMKSDAKKKTTTIKFVNQQIVCESPIKIQPKNNYIQFTIDFQLRYHIL